MLWGIACSFANIYFKDNLWKQFPQGSPNNFVLERSHYYWMMINKK